jgi:hypothetical protein
VLKFLKLKPYGNWARHHKESGSGAGEPLGRKADADTGKTAMKVVFAHSAKTEESRVGEKLGHESETQASARKKTRKVVFTFI